MGAAIFISYRRNDAGGHAGRLHDRLAHWFDGLFYDTHSIAPGELFPARLTDAIDAARVVLVLIGPDWLAELNRRAPLAEADFVRVEIERALQRRAGTGAPPLVIPVLVGGATAPAAAQLHPALAATIAPLLALDMHAFQGKDDDWNHQFVRLRELIAAVPGVAAPRFRAPAGTTQPYRVIEQSLSPHFSDPNHALVGLQRALEAARVVALCGMGGAGKTQLALKYSSDFRDRYAGVWWLRAESDSTLQLDALDACELLGVAVDSGDVPMRALRRWLGEQRADAPPWLLVFDNAEDAATLRPHLPDRGGHHVLITSRNPAWGGIASPLTATIWEPDQGADFLARRLPAHPSRGDAAALADLSDALGGLPLALEQAAGFLDETGMSAPAYAALVRSHDAASLVLDEGRAATGYERSVLATLSIAFPRLPADAAELLQLLAFCAPEPVPERLFRAQPDDLGPALAAAARQPLRWEKAIGALRRYGLAERLPIATLDRAPGETDNPRTEPALQSHRLTLEVARHRLVQSPSDAANALLLLLIRALPAEAHQPAHWARYAALAPHLLNIDRLRVDVQRRRLGMMLDRCATYFQSGPTLFAPARAALERALQIDRDDLGDTHPDTLISMANLAAFLSADGDLDGARELYSHVVAVRLKRLGDRHPDTLIAMLNLASVLWKQGDLGAAREVEKAVLAVRQDTLGERHPDTLVAMNNLAATMGDEGDHAGARPLKEHVVRVRCQDLGDEHPETLQALNNLATTLRLLGEYASAREIQEHVLEVRRRVLGAQHLETCNAMNNLAMTLWDSGDTEAAYTLLRRAVDAMRERFAPEHALLRTMAGNLTMMTRQRAAATAG